MDEKLNGLGGLTRREQRAVGRLLVAAVVAAERAEQQPLVGHLIDAAPVGDLPTAAALHRLSGVALRGLEGRADVPDEVLVTLDRHRSQAALHHLLVIGALAEITQAFDEQALGWVTMKGPILAELLYREAGDRTYADLDVLVVRGHFAQAMTMLEQLGYVPAIKNWALAEQMLAGQVTMTGPTIQIDLHWALHYSDDDRRRFGFVPEEMIERSRSVDIAGLRVPTFDAEDTLVTLAFHAARSGGHRLLWLKDLERSVAVDQPDLDEAARRAEASRCGPPVGLMLHRSARMLGAAVPSEIVRALVPPSLRLANHAVELMAPPVQLNERDSAARWLARSTRSTTLMTAADVPRRTIKRLLRTARPHRPNETNDPAEKASFLEAVSKSRGATS